MRRSFLLHMCLLLALTSGAACGGAAAGGPSGQTPGTTASASATSTATPAGTASVPAPTGSAPIPSALGADLQALGIDPANLPPIEKLEPKALRGVMKLVAKSLGFKCADCHVEGDFAATTRRKKIAAKMWDEFAAKTTMADGSPLFCDSCHQGRSVLLDRRDKKALGKWMDASFVGLLKRKDGKATECETCHVDQEMHLLARWSGQ
jgi:cytochrome c7-like protein